VKASTNFSTIGWVNMALWHTDPPVNENTPLWHIDPHQLIDDEYVNPL